MLPLLAVLLGLFVLLGQPLDVIGKCSIKTGSPSPLTLISFGSKNFIEDKTGVYEREEGEEIQFHCGSGFYFKYGSHGHDVDTTDNTKAALRCRDSSFYYENRQFYGKMEVHCQLNRVNQMFESQKSLPNCENDMSLVLGMDFGEIGSIKNAALCYDILGSKLKYFGYTTFPPNIRILETTQVGQLNELGLDVKVTNHKNIIRSINQLDIDTYMSAEKQVTSLFVNNAFQWASLAQDHELVGYEDMLGTVWLRELRSGNWANWLSALREASDAGSHFDVRIGVSGTLELPVPAVGQANVSRSMVVRLSDGSTLPVPAHIWAHVRALQSTGGGDEDEFVIIGHNSPFFRCYNSSSLCSSMCDQVSWLRGSVFATLHQFPAYGIVQCCRVEDVAQKLDHFPGAFVEAAATNTTAAPVDISAYKKTLSQILMKPELE